MLGARLRRAFALAVATTLVPSGARAQPAPARGEAPKPRLTKPPELVDFVEAVYPEDELREGRAATVVLELAISAAGAVEAAVVVKGAGAAFDAAAVDAARRFTFRPAEVDHKPAPVKITYRYVFTPKAAVETTGKLRGVVLDKASGRPLAGVAVEVDGVGRVVTNAEGEFAFDDVPVGEAKVTLSRSDLTPLRTQETVEAGRTLEARYSVELPAPEGAADDEDKDDFEVVVLAPKLVKQTVSTEVGAEEARRVPGTQGDVLKVVENLPGVARASAGSGQLVVWGAAPQDTRTYVGAVRVPMLYHFGGLRSVVHNDRVASVELVPGGYGAAYGRGLGGLVRVTTREPARDRLHGSAQLDLLDASAAVTAPIGERLSFAISARRSHVADAARLLEDQSFQAFFTLPEYHDGQARLRYQLAPNEWVEVGGMLSGDRQSRTQPSNDPANRVSETRTLRFERYDVAYHKQLADGAEVDVAPWYGHDVGGRAGDFGGVPTSVETESHLVGLRAEWRGRLAEAWTARAGLDLELVQSESNRSGSITSPPREGDAYVFGRAPADQVSADVWKSVIASAAPYAETSWGLFRDRVVLTPGVRLEPYFISVDRRKPHDPNAPDLGAYLSDVAIQPRFAARWASSERLTYKAAVGLYRQPPLPDDLSAIFGNPALGISTGTHYVGGAELRATSDLAMETNVFHTTSDELVARNPSSSPRVGEALLQQGEGRSVGAQFLLRREKGAGRFFGWIAYTILRSERKDSPGARWRLFDYDQTHVLTALASYDLGAGFEVGARARVASGYPRTPLQYIYFDARSNRYEPTLGVYNTDRIPVFLQLDVRVAKRVKLSGSELEVYLDVQNVTNRGNPEEIAYAPDYSHRRYILGLPILPILGARWSF
ncbi:MAG: TonB-dependent receptor [Labilithrix sp.]|nr:TonB-dependent receptor [Labilithrix sp.]MCW5836176.1 TonB-dependent receptor [Labilithrix sp.]